MNKLQSIIGLLIIGLLGASFITASTHETSPWYFSDQLNNGDHFEWNVRFYQNGSAVTVAEADVRFVNNSKIEINIYGNADAINVNGAYDTASLASAFELKIDGNPQDLLVNGTINNWLLLLLNPTDLFLPANTASYNYYHYLYDNAEPHFLFNSTGTIDTTSDSYRVTESRTYTGNENRTVDENAEYEIGRGILRYFNHYEVLLDENDIIDAQFYLVRDDSGDEGMNFEYFQFAAILNIGDVYTWEVINVEENGEVISTISTDGEPATGSEVKIEVIEEPEWFDFNNEPDDDPDDYFKFTVDGVILDINEVFDDGSFINFIFPIFVDYQNGTTINNFFEYIKDNPDTINLDDDETLDFTASEVRHTTTRLEEGYSEFEDITWQLDTGIMSRATFQELDVNGTMISEFKLELKSTDFANPGETTGSTNSNPSSTNGSTTASDSSEDTFVAGLPIGTFLIAFSGLIAIPILRKVRY